MRAGDRVSMEKDSEQTAEDSSAPEAAPAPKRAATRRKKPSAAKAPESASATAGKPKKRATTAKAKTAPRSRKAAVVVEVEPEQPQEAATNGAAPARRPLPRLQERLRNEITPALMKEFGYSTVMQVPRLEKIVLNIGLGEALLNARAIESATADLTMIAGQRPVTTKARKSIAGFKIRQGMTLGLSVTLRGRRMYEFIDRLVSAALPRLRDFRGVSRDAFDGRGNFAIGIREQVIFPEIDYNTIDRIRGLQVVVVTTARTDHEGMRMLEMLGMPFTRTAGDAAYT